MTSKKIRVGIVTTCIDNRRARGTAIVARRLVEGLRDFSDELDVTLIHPLCTDDPLYTFFPEIITGVIRFPFAATMLSEAWFWIKRWFSSAPAFDVVHYLQPRVWPSYLLTHARRVVITPHDAGIMLNLHPMGLGEYVFKLTNRWLHFRMDRLIAVSLYARDEIIKNFHVSGDRVTRIYNGIDPTFKKVNITDEVKTRLKDVYNISGDFILSVGRLEPHKNVLRLLDAYKILRDRGHTESFVILGGKHLHDYSARVEAHILELGLGDFVVVAPFVEADDLPVVYTAARALVYVSLHEGFGLPILEAYACETPVMISNTTSLPEIAGGGALMCDPQDVGAIADVMHNILTNEQVRAALIVRGSERAKDFTWGAMVRQVVNVYKELCASCL